MILPAGFTLQPAVPYCCTCDRPEDHRGSWAAFVSGFGFPVGGFGSSAAAAEWDALFYAARLLTDPVYLHERIQANMAAIAPRPEAVDGIFARIP